MGRKWLGLFCLFPLLLFSGCLGVTSLDDRAIVELLAVDWNGSGYDIQVSLFQAQENATAQAGGETVQNLVSGSGATMAQALESAASQAGKELFFANNELILLGEKAANEQLNPLLTYFNAHPQIRPSVRILITQGDARDFLEKEDSPQLAKDLLGTLENAEEGGLLSSAQLIDLIQQLEGPKGCAPIPVVGTENRHIQQLALAQPDGIALLISQEQANGSAWLTDSVSDRLLTLSDDQGRPITLRAQAPKGTIQLTGTQPLSYRIQVSVTLRVEESMDPIETDQIPQLEERIQQAIQEEIGQMLQVTALDRGIDLVGLSSVLRQKDPAFYKEYGQDLSEQLKSALFTVEVSAHLERIGMQAS